MKWTIEPLLALWRRYWPARMGDSGSPNSAAIESGKSKSGDRKTEPGTISVRSLRVLSDALGDTERENGTWGTDLAVTSVWASKSGGEHSAPPVVAGPPSEGHRGGVRELGGPGVEGARFVVLQEHARGGLGIVLKAVDQDFPRTVALKQLQDHLAEDEASRQRFLAEARITGRLEHPGIVPVYGLGEDAQGQLFYAMRFIEGRSLRDFVNDFHRAGGWAHPNRELELRQLLKRFIDVCNTLAFAHDRGVIHRDIKPANIMLGPYGETLVVDWGLAKPLGETDAARETGISWESGAGAGSSETAPGSMLGTPQYMSPEQASGDAERVGPASDLYSLGATLYTILVGRPPFDREDGTPILERVRRGAYTPARQAQPAVPRVLDAIVQRAMSLDPAARHASPADLATDLEHWLADEPIAGIREPLGQRLSRWERRHRALVRAGGLALLAVTVVSLASVMLINQSRNAERRLRLEITAQRREAVARGLVYQRQTATVLMDDGLALAQDGQVGRGLIQMVRALETLPAASSGLDRLIRANIADWSRELCQPIARMVHTNRVRGAVSPDGTLVATASDDHTARVWDARTGAAVSPVLQHPDEVNWIAFHPEGGQVATACARGGARLWDARTGVLLHQLEHSDSLDHLVFSPDGTRLLTSCEDGAGRLWNTQTGERIGQEMRHPSEVIYGSFSPDGTRIATAGEEGTARIWDARTGAPLTPAMRQNGTVYRLAFSPDGTRLGTTCTDGVVQIWASATGEPEGPPLRHSKRANTIQFHPSGRELLTTSDDGTAVVWDLENSRERLSLSTNRTPMVWAMFDAEGRRIVTASMDGTARIWDAGTGEAIGTPMMHENWVYQAFWFPDGGRILTTSRDYTAKIWNVPKHADARLLELPGMAIRSARIDRRRERCALGGENGWLAVVRLRDGKLLWKQQVFDRGLRHVEFSPDGRYLATGSLSGDVAVWDAETGAAASPRMKFPGWVLSVQYRPDGRKLLVAGSARMSPDLQEVPGLALCYDTTTWQTDRLNLRHGREIYRAVFSGDGRLIATASADRTARIWRADTGAPMSDALPHASEVWSIAFDPQGRKVVTAGQERDVRVWDLERLGQPRMVFGHPSTTWEACFDATGTAVYTASEDGLVRVWDLATGRRIGPGYRHPGPVSTVQELPESMRLLTACRDGARIWRLVEPEPGTLLEIRAAVEARTGLNIGTIQDIGSEPAPR
jgi:WD40 repeat protein